MSKLNTAFSLGLAHMLAQAHAEAGLVQFNELQRVCYEAKGAKQPLDALKLLQYAAPAAVSMALALELFLKVVHLQHFGSHPNIHDLSKLWSTIPDATQRAIAEAYAVNHARPLPQEAGHFNLAFAENAAQLPAVPVIALPTFVEAIAHLSDAFVMWRYVYERFTVPQNAGIDFKALICAIEAVQAAVATHGGNARVTFGP